MGIVTCRTIEDVNRSVVQNRSFVSSSIDLVNNITHRKFCYKENLFGYDKRRSYNNWTLPYSYPATTRIEFNTSDDTQLYKVFIRVANDSLQFEFSDEIVETEKWISPVDKRSYHRRCEAPHLWFHCIIGKENAELYKNIASKYVPENKYEIRKVTGQTCKWFELIWTPTIDVYIPGCTIDLLWVF